jgi:hypothetical protein
MQRGFLTGEAVRQLVSMDVQKEEQLVDFMVRCGWVNSNSTRQQRPTKDITIKVREPPPPMAPAPQEPAEADEKGAARVLIVHDCVRKCSEGAIGPGGLPSIRQSMWTVGHVCACLRVLLVLSVDDGVSATAMDVDAQPTASEEGGSASTGDAKANGVGEESS